jgi:hypothetical protein
MPMFNCYPDTRFVGWLSYHINHTDWPKIHAGTKRSNHG